MQVGIDPDQLAHRVHAETGQHDRQQHGVARPKRVDGMQGIDRVDESALERERRGGGQCGKPDGEDGHGCPQTGPSHERGVEP